MIELIKKTIKKIPFFSHLAIRIKDCLSSDSVQPAISSSKSEYVRQEISRFSDHKAREYIQLVNILNYTKTSGSSYSAKDFPSAYHTIEINGELLRGQRDPALRFETIPIDFEGKSVLDIGCNQGGMLFYIADKLRWGVGLDYDSRMVNAGNRIRSIRGTDKLNFYILDLEKEPLPLIRDFLPDSHVDIVFLLSVCMWVKNWQDVIDFVSSISDILLFESNGTDKQQTEQISYLEKTYSKVTLLQGESVDDPGQLRRKLFHCYNTKEKTLDPAER